MAPKRQKKDPVADSRTSTRASGRSNKRARTTEASNAEIEPSPAATPSPPSLQDPNSGERQARHDADYVMAYEMVEVVVGDGKIAFAVEKNLLCSHSDYFRKAFGSRFLEGEVGSIQLSDVSDITFKILLQWLHGQVIRSAINTVWPAETTISSAFKINDDDDDDDDDASVDDDFDPPPTPSDIDGFTSESEEDFNVGMNPESTGDEALSRELSPSKSDVEAAQTVYQQINFHLLDLYIFADKYDTRQLRNDIMTTICNFHTEHNTYPGPRLIRRAYSDLPASSNMCRYLTKTTALYWDPSKEPDQRDSYADLPSEFLFEVMFINARRVNGERLAEDTLRVELEDRCTFHEHTDEAEKDYCKSSQNADKVFFRNILVACMAAVS
jgi:hypothetical protein